MQLAYDALSPDMKTRLEGVCAIFSYAKRQAGYQEEKPLAESIKQLKRTTVRLSPEQQMLPRTRFGHVGPERCRDPHGQIVY